MVWTTKTHVTNRPVHFHGMCRVVVGNGCHDAVNEDLISGLVLLETAVLAMLVSHMHLSPAAAAAAAAAAAIRMATATALALARVHF